MDSECPPLYAHPCVVHVQRSCIFILRMTKSLICIIGTLLEVLYIKYTIVFVHLQNSWFESITTRVPVVRNCQLEEKNH